MQNTRDMHILQLSDNKPRGYRKKRVTTLTSLYNEIWREKKNRHTEIRDSKFAAKYDAIKYLEATKPLSVHSKKSVVLK